MLTAGAQFRKDVLAELTTLTTVGLEVKLSRQSSKHGLLSHYFSLEIMFIAGSEYAWCY